MFPASSKPSFSMSGSAQRWSPMVKRVRSKAPKPLCGPQAKTTRGARWNSNLLHDVHMIKMHGSCAIPTYHEVRIPELTDHGHWFSWRPRAGLKVVKVWRSGFPAKASSGASQYYLGRVALQYPPLLFIIRDEAIRASHLYLKVAVALALRLLSMRTCGFRRGNTAEGEARADQII